MIDDERRRTVALLLDVANDPRFALRRQELSDLATAVRLGGAQHAGWREVDLVAAFAADTTMRLRPRRRRQLSRILGVLAVAFLVLPVARIWWSFGAALEGYRQVLEAGAAQGLGLLQFWTTAMGGQLAERHLLPAAVASAGTLFLWSVVLFAASWVSARSAARAEAEDADRGAVRLARAMTRATNVINARTVEDPVEGVEVLTEATIELLRAQQATQQSLQLLEDATRRLEDSAGLLLHGTNAVGKALGLHTGALQHQISELTQVRASLERISGLALDEGGE